MVMEKERNRKEEESLKAKCWAGRDQNTNDWENQNSNDQALTRSEEASKSPSGRTSKTQGYRERKKGVRQIRLIRKRSREDMRKDGGRININLLAGRVPAEKDSRPFQPLSQQISDVSMAGRIDTSSVGIRKDFVDATSYVGEVKGQNKKRKEDDFTAKERRHALAALIGLGGEGKMASTCTLRWVFQVE